LCSFIFCFSHISYLSIHLLDFDLTAIIILGESQSSLVLSVQNSVLYLFKRKFCPTLCIQILEMSSLIFLTVNNTMKSQICYYT
jgi:hypothetical protein